MSLFRKKCEYCSVKIKKGKEIPMDVKIPGIVGTSEKAFCCSGHAENYEKEIEEHMKKSRSGGCCR